MSKPEDIPQDVLAKAQQAEMAAFAARSLGLKVSDTEIIARAIMAAEKRGEEREREDIWAIASGNAAGERELERLAHQAGDDRDALIHSLLASENEQLAAAIRKRGEG